MFWIPCAGKKGSLRTKRRFLDIKMRERGKEQALQGYKHMVRITHYLLRNLRALKNCFNIKRMFQPLKQMHAWKSELRIHVLSLNFELEKKEGWKVSTFFSVVREVFLSVFGGLHTKPKRWLPMLLLV